MSEISIEDRGYLALSLVDGMSIIKKYDLLERVGGIVELYTNYPAHTDEIIEIAGANNFTKLNNIMLSDSVDRELERLYKLDIDIIAIDSPYYPMLLKDIDTPPLMLFCRGNKAVLNNEDTLGIVGTRAPSRYGKDVTRDFARSLAKSGLTIVSGLARGVDSISHKATLEEGGTTIAVVANGLDICYPQENYELSERICENGAIISEYPLGATPFAYRFPERNRIISGISKGILITEAGRKSGSLITLGQAIDQGRNVYIIPGAINNPSCFGSNDAIKQLQGAIVTETADIIKDYNVKEAVEEEEEIPLSDFERKLVEYIKREDRHIDEISAFVSDIGINELLATLSKLELYGLIQRLPGNYYGK